MPNWIWVAVMVAAIALFVYLFFRIARDVPDDDLEFRIQHDHWPQQPEDRETTLSDDEIAYRNELDMRLR
jgi:hypothetical protein